MTLFYHPDSTIGQCDSREGRIGELIGCEDAKRQEFVLCDDCTVFAKSECPARKKVIGGA